MQTISNLVFEGGGVGAIAYAGFLSKAESNGWLLVNNIKRIAGVSSGAIAGLQVALNYSVKEIATEMKSTNFKKFAYPQHGWIAGIFRLFMKEGLYDQDYLCQYIGSLIKAKTGNEYVTFHDLQTMKTEHHFKDLYILTTKLFLLNGQPAAVPFVFSHEHTPHARVIDAIRASTALPIIFPPVRLHKEENGQYTMKAEGDVYVDGGILQAYPIHLFDHPQYREQQEQADEKSVSYNPETLGLRLESPINIQLIKDKQMHLTEQIITTRLQYAEALLYVLRIGQQEVAYATSTDQKRTILINALGITSTDFNLTDQQKEALIQSGEIASEQLVKLLKKSDE